MSKKLKVNDKVVISFLGAKYEGQVVNVRPDSHYDIRKNDGILIPKCAWQKDAHKKAPWMILAKIADGEPMPDLTEKSTKSEDISKQELHEKIEQQKDFVRGKFKK